MNSGFFGFGVSSLVVKVQTLVCMNFVGNFMFTKEGVFLNRHNEEFAL